MIIKKSISHRLSPSLLISFSLVLYIVLYFLPVSIILADSIRKPLLFFSLGTFLFALLMFDVKYLLYFIAGVLVSIIYYCFSWAVKLSFASYVFPAMVSIEMLVCSILLLEKKIIISEKIIIFISVVILTTSVTSIIGLKKYPMAIRTLGQIAVGENAALQITYRKANIAGWNLLFGIAFFQGPLMYKYITSHKIGYLVILSINEICIFYSQLAFAILLSISLVFFVLINGGTIKFQVRVSCAFFIIIILWLEREVVLTWILELAQKSNMYFLKLRAQNVYNLVLRHDTSGDAGDRFELYMKSINAFLANPQGAFLLFEPSKVGFHSEFLDFIGTMGMFGIGIVIATISKMSRCINKISKKYDKRFYGIESIAFLILFILNPVLSSPHMWMCAFVIPAIIVTNQQRTRGIVNNILLIH